MGKARKNNPSVPRPAVLKKLARLRVEIAERVPLKRLILFGSHAKGLARPSSDFDFCLVFADKEKNIEDYCKKIIIYLNYHQQIGADVLAFHEKDYQKNKTSPILHEIRTYGIEIKA